MTGSDPLAELARLIGKNDPYAEFGLSASRQEEQQELFQWSFSAHEGRDPASSHQHQDHRYDEGYSEVSRRGRGRLRG